MIKRAILFLFIIMVSVLLWGESRGLTCRELAEPQNPAGARATTWRGTDYKVDQHIDEINMRGWELADSVDINTFLGAGENISVEYSGASHQITVTGNNEVLSEAAREAVEKSPEWIRAELSTTLGLLEEETQIFWAEVINEVDDPIVDEVAFCIATASDVYLESDYAYPELYIQNAEMIYEYDQELSYVEVIDYGNSLVDDDYYTTTRYWSKTAEGVVHQVEVPRDIYYWHIVHPKITDEIPAFINPNVVESNSTHNNNIVGPEEGYFWRDFLYNYADEDYPSLRNYLIQCEYANDFTTGYNSAIGACTQWLGQSLQFTSNFERPHQPVRIYRKHIGRCGEHADMRVAIGRIALVPMTSIVCFTVDHTWNEFWDGEWVHWDGGSINNYYMYEQGWGSNFGSVIDVRSDGLMTPVTEKYAPNYANLTVHALDGAGEPIDGARVLIGLRLNGQVTGDMVGWTDNEGVYEFPIGDGHEYWVSMSTSWGNVEYQLVAENTAGGDEYEVELQIGNNIPQVQFTDIAVPDDDGEDYRLVVEYEVEDQVIFGNIVMDDTSEDTWFYERRTMGAVNFFMCDLVQYFSYMSGLEFEAFNSISESDFGYFGFDMPYPDLGSWYAVIDNGNNVTNPQWLKGSIALYRWEGTGGSATLFGNVADAGTGELLAGASVRAGAFCTETAEDGTYFLEVYPGEYTVIFDHPLYEQIRYTGIELSAGEEMQLSSTLYDDPIAPLNLTVTGDNETNAVVSWEAPESLICRSLTGYWVYRFLDEDEFVQENWIQLTGAPIAETEFTDTAWLSLPAGEYRYGVCAQYSNVYSDFTISSALPLNMTVEVEFVLSTNSGDSAAGAIVRIENTEGVNSPYNYEAAYPPEGNLIFQDVWQGSYELSIELDFFAGITDSVIIIEDSQFEYEMVELLPGPHFPGADDYYLSWDKVPADREFIDYQVWLDGEMLGTFFEPDVDLAEFNINADQHTIEIYAHYSSGMSSAAEIVIIDGSSLDHELLAHFPFDDNMIDSVNSWEGFSETVILAETPFGNGADFNGQDYITIPANPDLIEAALHYTILFWINADTQNTGWRGVIGRPGRNHCVWLNGDNDYVHHRFHTSGGGTNDGAPNTPNGSFHWQQWNQVAVINDGYKSRTYINGELLAEGLINSELIADSTDMYIGKSPDSPSAEGYLAGMVDEVRIWNRGLSDLELRRLYLEESEALGSGILSGTISDAASGAALQGVSVFPGMFHTITDAEGIYEISLPPGIYDLTFTLADYMTQYAGDVMVLADETNTYNFVFELTGEAEDLLPKAKLLLVNNFPNPFYHSKTRSIGTTFIMDWNGASIEKATLAIYNIKGRKVIDTHFELQPGMNEYYWDGKSGKGSSGASGIYFYQVKAGTISSSGKLLILR